MNNNTFSANLDETDLNILKMLTQSKDNKQISSILGIPLSTIQRRVRKLIAGSYIESKSLLNYEKFGYKSGLIHIYLSDGNLEDVLDKVAKIKGVVSLEVHIGNSDILADVIYKQGTELLNIITKVKKLEGVERTVWSERILKYAIENKDLPVSI